MSNDCKMAIYAVGRTEDIDALCDRFMRGVWDACCEGRDSDHGIDIVRLTGICSWSLRASMRDGADDDDPNGMIIERVSHELSLDMEAFSWEPGIGLSEHLIVRDGAVVDDERRPYHVYWRYELEELAEESTGVRLSPRTVPMMRLLQLAHVGIARPVRVHYGQCGDTVSVGGFEGIRPAVTIDGWRIAHGCQSD